VNSLAWLDAVAQSKTLDELRDALQRRFNSIGIEYFTVHDVTDLPQGKVVFDGFYEIPPAFNAVFSDTATAKHDPVMQTMKHSSLPLVWDREFYARAGALAIWERQAEFGVKYGIDVVMHMPRGKHFALGFFSDAPVSNDDAVVTEVVGGLQLLTAHAEAAYRRITQGNAIVTDRSSFDERVLTAREREVLKWGADGKTAWETGRILSISESAVRKHMESVIAKLGSANKQHAIATALRTGVIV
jgi:DNA-binding CsgD family transcriptional regulator